MAAACTLSHSTSAPPQFYLDDKWKLSKKESSSRSCRSSTNTPTTPTMKNSSQRRCSFSRKCARLVKEQRARFYIMRRCVTMLICWRDYTDS
ncbi:Small polypeptide DEVIL 11 [Linum grandiflorum]